MLMHCEHELLTERLQIQGEQEDKRYLYIMLLRYPDRFSKVYRFFSRSKYSHASIGVSHSDWTFFSYVLKGFRTELPKKHPTFKQQEIPCELYRAEISEEVYNKVKSVLDDHIKRSHNCRFSYLGLVLCYLGIRIRLKDRYFCSQFVSEIIEKAEAVPLAKHSSLYLPDDFMAMNGLDHCYSGNLSQLVNPKAAYIFSFA